MNHFKHGRHGAESRRQNNHSRSRSPYRASHADSHRHKRWRTEDEPSRSSKHASTARSIPSHARQLSKHDFDGYQNIFALYLDIQKQIRIEDLDEKEVKGRWKSFLGKWNRGELAEGWYDAATKRKADEAGATVQPDHREGARQSPDRGSQRKEQRRSDRARHDDTSDDDDGFGPALPVGGARVGPAIPNVDDLSLVAEQRAEDEANAIAGLRYDRKAERTLQKERLEELVPRADPGSRERQLEKKREVGATLATFREAKESGDVEVKDSDLMGDDVDGFRRRKKEMERKKNDREIRKEEQLRARMAEREERMKKAREKEEKTMDYLKALARERYGA